MRAVLSAALLVLAPLPLVAQSRDSATFCSCSSSRKPNLFYFGHARGEGPVIGVETSSGSVRDTLGVLVVGVTPNGPADKAGIEEGDRLATANGIDLRLSPADAGDREMRGLMSRRLARAVQKVKAGDAVELRVYHDGQYRSVKVTTVKASDLAFDDINLLPEVRSGPMLDDMQVVVPDMEDMHFQVPDMSRIKLQMRDMRPFMGDLRRSIERLKRLPIEVYDSGVHRI